MFYAVNKQTKEHKAYSVRSDLPASVLSGNYNIIQADADGWIEWHGGECPLPADTRYQTAHLSGWVFDGNHPQTFTNHWLGYKDPVVKYRPTLSLGDEPQASKDRCVTVRYDLGPASVEGAIREKLIEMGWTPPQDGLPEWDGEGVPSTGCKVSYPSGRGIVRLPPDAYKVVIVEDDEGGYKRVDVRALEPIRTDREEWVAEAYKHISDDLLASMDWSRHSEMVIEDIYEALKSGGLPTPKTGNRH